MGSNVVRNIGPVKLKLEGWIENYETGIATLFFKYPNL